MGVDVEKEEGKVDCDVESRVPTSRLVRLERWTDGNTSIHSGTRAT